MVKPGLVPVSFHPTTTDEDIQYRAERVCDVIKNIDIYKKDNEYVPRTNDFRHNVCPIDPVCSIA